MVIKTKVNEDKRTTVPKIVRELLDIHPEDEIIWIVSKNFLRDGVRVVKFVE